MFEEFLSLPQILPFICYKILYGGLFIIFIGFMEAQVNLEDGSRWSPDSLLKKYSNGALTVVTDSVVEKVRIQLYHSCITCCDEALIGEVVAVFCSLTLRSLVGRCKHFLRISEFPFQDRRVRRRQQFPLRCRYLSTKLHGATLQKTNFCNHYDKNLTFFEMVSISLGKCNTKM
jgi:hypothetical protein